jgi:hypothetical protein
MGSLISLRLDHSQDGISWSQERIRGFLTSFGMTVSFVGIGRRSGDSFGNPGETKRLCESPLLLLPLVIRPVIPIMRQRDRYLLYLMPQRYRHFQSRSYSMCLQKIFGRCMIPWLFFYIIITKTPVWTFLKTKIVKNDIIIVNLF